MSIRLWFYSFGILLIIILASATTPLNKNSTFLSKNNSQSKISGLSVKALTNAQNNQAAINSQAASATGSSMVPGSQVQIVAQNAVQGTTPPQNTPPFSVPVSGEASSSAGQVTKASPVNNPITNPPPSVLRFCLPMGAEPYDVQPICQICSAGSPLIDCGGCSFGKLGLMCAAPE